MQGTADISPLPFFRVMDMFSYLLTNSISFSALRDYRRSESYTLMMDGYVSIVTYPHTENTYFAVKAKVKPRTREKDPVSGATFYYPWVIISSVGTDTRSCILSGFCTCKGGIDGCCRHVQATLYEVMDYRGYPTHASVTSGPCLWVRRATANYSAALLTELVTSSGENRRTIVRTIVPIQGQYQPVPNVGIIKPVEDFLKVVKECKTDARMLHAWEKQPRNRFFNPLPLSVSSPLHRMAIFLQNHSCDVTGCDCAQVFLDTMAYSEAECNLIERET